MKKTTVLLLTVLFLLLTAQTSCRQETCERLDAVDDIRLRLVGLGVVFDDLEDLLAAINDGRLEKALADLREGHAQAVAAVEALLVIVKALCPEDLAEINALLGVQTLGAASAETLEEQLEGILERAR